MFKNAIDKIQAEMNQGTPYVQAVGAFLLQHLEANPGSAEKIMTQDKTLGKSIEEMRKAAEKKKVGNCAVLTYAEGFAVVLKYFGIEAPVNMSVPATPPVMPAPAPPAVDFDIKLDDLL